MIIAIDFDGTIVEHKYPCIGKDISNAIKTMKALQRKEHKLILWTYRSGDLLQDAIDYCKKRGVSFYAINKNYPEEVYDTSFSRKIIADLFIDDRNFGGLPDWNLIYDMYCLDGKEKKSKCIFSFLFKIKNKK